MFEKLKDSCEELGGSFKEDPTINMASCKIEDTEIAYWDNQKTITAQREGTHVQMSNVTDITAMGPSKFYGMWRKKDRTLWVHSKEGILIVGGDGRIDMRV